ncbi:tandem-95 repeat protein [Neorhizobium alkalisoli]|uniref:Hemolysin type calcium-binding protein n=1 Tax=Neorhizobium alkalisoli TaxID=528178 RepID=A0A561R9N7_9HYPH|nr:Ig-like domain-containing protein [Neorhizobium alkalisoli]TWF59313.1 hemolysin type calcium-binding protein [Neorhizobium alkalisoli]
MTNSPVYSGAFNFAFVSFNQGQIDAGNITANQIGGSNQDNNVLVTLEGHSEFFALDHGRIGDSNRGDYHVRAGGATNDFTRGVFIASVAQNGVDWGFDDGIEYGAAAIGIRSDNSVFVSVNNSLGNEYNTNVSVANFDFERYIGAWVRDNGHQITTAGQGSSRIHTQRNNDASYTIKIDGVNSLTDGVLLITGAENRAQYGAARPLADGSGWVIDVHDNVADGYANTGYEYGFTFIPKGDAYTTFGRVLSDGSSSVSNGNYTINKIGVGEYELYIDGKTPKDGALLVTSEGLDGANIDNVVSYQPMANGKGWIVQTRDFPSGQLEDAGLHVVPDGLEHMNDAVDPHYVGASVDAIIASYEDAKDGNSLIAAHRMGYWENNTRILAENSLSSVERSISLGVDILETDLMRTKDGHYVLMHDGSINRTTTGSGNVSDLTLEQLRTYNLKIEGSNVVTDEKIPTVEELFAAIKGKAMVNLDKVAVSDFAAVSALAEKAGVANQVIFKAAINNEGDIATIKAALAASAPGVHFMPIMYPGISPTLVAKAFAELHPDAVEINVNPNSHGWVTDPGPFFTDQMKAVFDQYDVRYFINTLFAGQDNADGSMSGGRGDFVALGRPDLVFGYWADQGVSIFQTDELRIAANYLNTYGYRIPLTDGDDGDHNLIQGTDGDDVLTGGSGSDVVLGGLGNDTIDGGAGDDTLIGNEGNDTIKGGDGDDLIDGGEGNDTLIGGNGSDRYIYSTGSGSDVIIEGAGKTGDRDQLFLDDAARGDVVFHRNGSDIEIQIGSETITLKDQLAGGGVEVISFADGTVLVGDQISGAVVNRGPVVTTPALAVGNEDTQIIGQIVASDADKDTLAFAIKDGFGPAHGAISLDAATGAWTYDPTANYNGADHFTVVVSDGHGGLVEQVIDISVTPVNDGPVAVNDTGSVMENETKVFDLVANDTDIDGNALSLSGFTVEGVDGVALSAEAAKAAFSIVDGKLTFTPGSLFAGLNDGDTATLTLSYTVSDGTASDTGSFTLTVNGEGKPQNVIIGDEGSNILMGTDQDDAITAYGGGDYAFGRDGADVIDGGDGNDYLFGGNGADVINGGVGNDTLFGDAGDDVLIGDKGNDRMTGGAGNDSFVFRSGFGHDTILDFGGGDIVDISKADFADFAELSEHLADTALGTVLTLDDHSTLTFANVDKAHLTADQFHFAA